MYVTLRYDSVGAADLPPSMQELKSNNNQLIILAVYD